MDGETIRAILSFFWNLIYTGAVLYWGYALLMGIVKTVELLVQIRNLLKQLVKKSEA